MSGEFVKQARPISPLTKDINALVSSLNSNQPKIVVQSDRNSNSHPVFLCLFSARIWTIIFVIFKLILYVISFIAFLYLLVTFSTLGGLIKDEVDRLDQAEGLPLQNDTNAILQFGKTMFGVTLGLSLLLIVLNSLALFGAAKEILCLVFLWIVLLVLEIVGLVIYFIMICIQFQVAPFLLNLLFLVVHAFFLIVAIRFRKDVEQNRSVHP